MEVSVGILNTNETIFGDGGASEGRRGWRVSWPRCVDPTQFTYNCRRLNQLTQTAREKNINFIPYGVPHSLKMKKRKEMYNFGYVIDS